MSQAKFTPIRCPRCKHLLFEALGISAHMVIRIKCPQRTCRDDIVQVREGWEAVIIPLAPLSQDRQASGVAREYDQRHVVHYSADGQVPR